MMGAGAVRHAPTPPASSPAQPATILGKYWEINRVNYTNTCVAHRSTVRHATGHGVTGRRDQKVQRVPT